MQKLRSTIDVVFSDRRFAFSWPECGLFPRFLGTSSCGGRTSPVGSHQEVSRPMQIRQPTSNKEPMRVLDQALVADLAELVSSFYSLHKIRIHTQRMNIMFRGP